MPADNAEEVPVPARLPFRISAALLGSLVAVPCTALVLVHGFAGLYGQDAFGYIDYALGPLIASIRNLQPPPPFFWPPGYPLLVAITGSVGVGERAGQIVAIMCGAALPIAIALLARELLARRYSAGARDALALLAGASAGVAGQLWQSSVVAMSDTTGALLATLGAWACCRYYASGGPLTLAASAAAFAYAIQVRWIYGLVALPFVILALARLARDSRISLRAASLTFVVALGASVVVLAPAISSFAAAIAQGHPLPFVGDFEVYKWSLAGGLQTTFTTVDGSLSYQLPTALFYLLQPFQTYWLFSLGILAIPGLIVTMRWRDPMSAAALVAWPALVLLFHIGGAYQNTRFFLAALTPTAILVAVGAGWLWRVAERKQTHLPGVTKTRLVALALVAALAANAMLALRFTNSFVERQSADVAAIWALAAHVPSEARIISLGATAALRHGGRDVAELFDLDSAAAAALLADGQRTYLLVDANAVHGQFAELESGRTVSALERDPGLSVVASSGMWTLYLIGP